MFIISYKHDNVVILYINVKNMPIKIYTKTGDTGETSLFTGERVKKSSLRVQAYGAVDELNSWLGLLCSTVIEKDIQSLFTQIQNELFDLGADLATPAQKAKNKRQKEVPRISEKQIHQLEKWIDQYQEELPPLKNFILPGGAVTAAYIHITRGVCRRAERWVVQLMEKENVEMNVLIYLNRLSDLLFVLARVLNHRQHFPEPLWSPKKL
jgi:cob(I)alamin adenosyltransferase